MLDTRCWNCAKNIEVWDDAKDYHPDFAYKEYQGKGIFKCPRCNDILDISDSTYIIKISREYDEEGELFTNFIEYDHSLKDGKDSFEEDMNEYDVFDHLPFGKYLLEVYWLYYQCGGYEYPNEWDLDYAILMEEETKE